MNRNESLRAIKGDANLHRDQSDQDGDDDVKGEVANIRIDDSQLERNLASIVQRLSAIEVAQSPQSTGGVAAPAGFAGAFSGDDDKPGSAFSGARARSANTSGALEKLIRDISVRLGRLESMVESAAADKTAEMNPSGGGDEKRIALSSASLMLALNEASKPNPSMPNLIRTIFKEITAMMARVKRFEDTIEQNKAFQDNKDKAQDEGLSMEINRIDQDIQLRCTRDDLDRLERKFKQELKSLKQEMEEAQEKQGMRIASEVGAGVRVLREQVKTINEATRGITDNLDGRLKKLEKNVEADLEELEVRMIDAISQAVTKESAKLTHAAEERHEAALSGIKEAKSHISEVIHKQEELEHDTEGEAEKLESALDQVTQKLTTMLDGGGIAEMILKGTAPAIEILDKKFDEEMSAITGKLRNAAQAAVDDQVALEERVKTETTSIRAYLEGEVTTHLGSLDGTLERLQRSTEDQVASLNSDLERNKGGFENTCAGLNESLSRAHKHCEGTTAELAKTELSLRELAEATSVRAGSAEVRLTQLEHNSENDRAGAAGTRKLLGETNTLAKSTEEGLLACHKGVAAGQSLCERMSEEVRNHKRALDGDMHSLAEDLNGRLDEDRIAIVGLEKAAKAQSAVSDDLRDSFGALVTKESFWDVMEKRTKWHAERLGKFCNETEASCSASDAPRLSPEAKKHLSGHAQRIAKVIAAQADASVLEDMVAVGVPKGDSAVGLAMQWDDKVDSSRLKILGDFVGKVELGAKRGRPFGLGDDHYVVEGRKMYLDTLSLALKLALSKFTRILPAETMLGVRGLAAQNGACAACARPFGASAKSMAGDKRAGNPEATFEKVVGAAGAPGGGSDGDAASLAGGSTGGHGRRAGPSSAGVGGSEYDNGSAASSGGGSRNPFKQAQRKGQQPQGGSAANGRAPKGGTGKIGLMGSIGEWDDAASVSSMASSSLGAGIGGNDVIFPAL